MHALLLTAASLAGLALAPSAQLPTLDHEPLLRVLIARAPRVTIELEREALLEVAGARTTLPAGTFTLAPEGGGWHLSGPDRDRRIQTTEGVLKSGGRPVFSLEAIPEFGAPRRLTLAGDLVLRAEGALVEVIERVRMESYLVGVVTAEMKSTWPREALAAQAIVARSYAAARWMERFREPWHVHWHFGVDMAYHGAVEAPAVSEAVASTRGQVLIYRGFPVLALFHASSGGRTEAFERIKPGVFAPDGATPIAAAMPVVDDGAALPGADGLELAASHGRWKTRVPLSEVSARLEAWSRAGEGRPAFGEVEAISVLERHADSGRVGRVSVKHRLDGATRFTALAGTDFRLAVDPVRLRSLFWDRCVVAAEEPPYLLLEGRGFGHGCGLSQVSAWYLARRGESAPAIVARFYAGARIERRY